jgi:hypothetical protein
MVGASFGTAMPGGGAPRRVVRSRWTACSPDWDAPPAWLPGTRPSFGSRSLHRSPRSPTCPGSSTRRGRDGSAAPDSPRTASPWTSRRSRKRAVSSAGRVRRCIRGGGRPDGCGSATSASGTSAGPSSGPGPVARSGRPIRGGVRSAGREARRRSSTSMATGRPRWPCPVESGARGTLAFSIRSRGALAPSCRSSPARSPWCASRTGTGWPSRRRGTSRPPSRPRTAILGSRASRCTTWSTPPPHSGPSTGSPTVASTPSTSMPTGART